MKQGLDILTPMHRALLCLGAVLSAILPHRCMGARGWGALLRAGYMASCVLLASMATLSAQTVESKLDSVQRKAIDSAAQVVAPRPHVDSTALQASRPHVDSTALQAPRPQHVDSTALQASRQLIDSLQQVLALQSSRMQQIQQERDSLTRWADTLLMHTIEVRLYRRYNEQRIQSRLQDVERRLVDKTLLKRYSTMMQLLNSYGQHNAELRAVLQKIEDAQLVGLSMRSKADTEKAVQLIRQLPYYRLYYGKEWSIGYLDERIQLALARIEETQRGMHKTTLKDIIDSL